MIWNDTASASLTATYNLTGLLPNFDYNVTNSTTYRTIKTDSNGNLNIDIYLTNSVETTISATAINPISSCGTLSSAGTYTLTQNVNSAGTCFTIGADNITLDGAGYTINYSQSEVGHGIDNDGGYDNITIQNLNIVQTNDTVYNSHTIQANGMINSIIRNNIISPTVANARAISTRRRSPPDNAIPIDLRICSTWKSSSRRSRSSFY